MWLCNCKLIDGTEICCDIAVVREANQNTAITKDPQDNTRYVLERPSKLGFLRKVRLPVIETLH